METHRSVGKNALLIAGGIIGLLFLAALSGGIMSDSIEREITSGHLKVEVATKLRSDDSRDKELLKLVQLHAPILKKHMSDESLSEAQKERPHRDFVVVLVKLAHEAPETETALTAKLMIAELLSYCMIDEEERGTGRDRKMHIRRFQLMDEIRRQPETSWQTVFAEFTIAKTSHIPPEWGISKTDVTTQEFLQRDYRKLKLPPAEVLDFLHLDSSASDPLRVLILHWIFANEYNQATDPIAQYNRATGAITLKSPLLDQAGLERAKALGQQLVREFPTSRTGKQIEHLLKFSLDPMLLKIPLEK